GESAPVCGIAGVIALSDRGPDPSVVEHMTRRLDDRSSHAWGYYVDGGVGLGIAGPAVAASPGPDQPATNEERSVRVVLAGRIFASEVDAAVVHPALNSERDLATVRRSLSFDVDRQAPLKTPLTNIGR